MKTTNMNDINLVIEQMDSEELDRLNKSTGGTVAIEIESSEVPSAGRPSREAQGVTVNQVPSTGRPGIGKILYSLTLLLFTCSGPLF